MTRQGSTGNVIAAVCSFFIPGLGQLVQGRVLAALIQFLLCGFLWWFMLGWIVSLLIADTGVPEMGRFAGRMGGRAEMVAPWHDTLQEAVRALMVVLTAVILAVTAIRTKGQVLQSIAALRPTNQIGRVNPGKRQTSSGPSPSADATPAGTSPCPRPASAQRPRLM